MLTGHTRDTAHTIGRQVGIDRPRSVELPQDQGHEMRRLRLVGWVTFHPQEPPSGRLAVEA